MQVTITREAGTVFGPVTSLFAQVLGYPTSTVSASATAYLGYTNEVQTGGVQLPLALPATGTQQSSCLQRPRRLVCASVGTRRGRGLRPQDD